MGKTAIPQEIAQAEVDKWIEYKKLDEDEIKEKESQIKTLVSAIKNGRLVLTKDFKLVQTLKFPLDSLTELTYAPRLNVDAIAMKLDGIDSTNPILLVATYAAASAGVVNGIIGKLDTADNRIAQAIGSFFL